MTFKSTKPTMQEYIGTTLPVYDISFENWNPSSHFDDPCALSVFQDTGESLIAHVKEMNEILSDEEEEEIIFSEEDAMLSPTDIADILANTREIEDFVDQESETYYDAYVAEVQHLGEPLADSGEVVVDNDIFHDAVENLESNVNDNLYYYDPFYVAEPLPGKVMNLTIDFQLLPKENTIHNHQCSVLHTQVDDMLDNMDYYEMTGHNQEFDSLICAITTVEQLQHLETIQPRLAWKPLEVIKWTLENTTQFARTIFKFPMTDHHKSRFPWDNRRRLQEDVAMDTYFSDVVGIDGSTCAQVYVGLISKMINVYPMLSKASGHILRTYQDFMRYEGVPECLHRDLLPEQQVDRIIHLNRDMMVNDLWSEAHHPNQNSAESLGVKPLKMGVDMIMNRTGAPAEV